MDIQYDKAERDYQRCIDFLNSLIYMQHVLTDNTRSRWNYGPSDNPDAYKALTDLRIEWDKNFPEIRDFVQLKELLENKDTPTLMREELLLRFKKSYGKVVGISF